MLTRALWLQLCVWAFRDEVFGTALQKLRQWCQHRKNLITQAGCVVVGFSHTQQNMKKKTSAFFFSSVWPFGLVTLPSTCEPPHSIHEIWEMCDLVLCALLVRFLSQKSWSPEILNENKLDKTSHFPSLRMFFNSQECIYCRAVSGYFSNRKDDTRTYCNYIQRYRFSPVFTCKTCAISFGILKNPLLWLSYAIESLLCPGLWPLVEEIGSDLGRAAG